MTPIQRLQPAAALALLLAGPAGAAGLDFSGSNIYMKFLDGNQRSISNSSGDTASGADSGQWTEFELRIKATVSKQVEAGVRLQSRSPAAYWTDYGFNNNEGFSDTDAKPAQSKFIKLRGAYVLLTPGYAWLDTALLGSSDWGMFDPFTVGKVRYIDRDNYNGIYLKGPLPQAWGWEAARVSLPNYLGFNYGNGPTAGGNDSAQYNEAVYIGQVKAALDPVKLIGSFQFFNDRQIDPADPTPTDGRNTITFYRNTVASLKAETSVAEGIDLRAALYRSTSTVGAGAVGQDWGLSPRGSINDRAIKLDAEFTSLPVAGLSLSAQAFDIGPGFYSNLASRRETDVLLTEGSEAAWFNWGQALWAGGAAKDYTQSPATPRGLVNKPSANGLIDNNFIDFDESPAESVLGWKGLTLLGRYELDDTPLALELTTIGYGNNWQNYPADGPLANLYAANQDRRTRLLVFNAGHVFPVLGGLQAGFKWKRVVDRDSGAAADSADDRETRDDGYSLSVGNQVFNDLFASVSVGRYQRDITLGAQRFDNKKTITSLRVAYNLAGFELGGLAQLIDGRGDPAQSGTQVDIRQHRMKVFAKVIF